MRSPMSSAPIAVPSASDTHADDAGIAYQGAPPPLGEALLEIGRRFERDGALGLLIVDATALAEIERTYGPEAHQRSMRALANFVSDTIRFRLVDRDLMVQGETGRSELLIALFRDARDARFQREGLPELCRVLQPALAAQGHRVAHPYLPSHPTLSVGCAFQLYNPTRSAATQIRAAIEEARGDSELNARLIARDRRRRLVGLLVAEQVYSVYEPIVEVATRTVFGYEALARGPAGSELQSPMTLFQRAAEEGLVFELDALCRRRGLEGALDLPKGTKLFLNFRPTTIYDPSFRADSLRSTLDRCQLQPSDIVFEISEQESIDNYWLFREVRDYYGSLGFQIALDDTGAGYASLEAVMELSPEFIKVDRAFVRGIDQDASRQELLRALHAVAGRIGSQIIAEGLDTLEELTTLGELGIPYGQGWLFGKATPLRAPGQ
jgi:EAL domain-containing protein (putative c-di-GMP-specific phosphodiesterase class I)